jgi:hypothetical protein
MGNTVSSAEVAAAQIFGSTETEFTRRPRGGSPPFSCPRHRHEMKVIVVVVIIIIITIITITIIIINVVVIARCVGVSLD